MPPRSCRRVFDGAAVTCLALVAAVALTVAGCGSARGPTAVVTLPAPSSTARSIPRSTPPTTKWVATAPQTSPDAAAARLIGAWAAADRTTAATVAAPGAVAKLFAVAYPGASLALSRGCSAAFTPIVCTYGPPGGASPTDPVFEVFVSQSGAGWYVSSVRTLT